MSILHIKIEMINRNNNFVEYKIISPDFNNEFKDENFGIIVINLLENTYIHKENELWIKNKIYPLSLFELEADEREEIIKEKYSAYGSGIWAMKIFNYIKECLAKNEFLKEKTIVC
jgi:hypothetical protein